MRFEFVFDKPQYDDCLSPLLDAAVAAGIDVSTARYSSLDYRADAHFVVQNFALASCPSPTVFVPHGLSLLKRFEFDLHADAVVVPSHALHEALGATIPPGTASWPGIGYPKMDRLLELAGRAGALREAVRRAHGFDARPLVVYMPTWKNRGVPLHHQRLYRLDEVERTLSGAFNVVVMAHDLDVEKDELRALRSVPLPSVRRLDYLLAADLVLTDNSGVGFECAAIDKPMVLLGNPDVPDYFRDQVTGMDRPVDYGPVATLETLVDDVARAVAEPDARASSRRFWGERVFGPLDGGASRRVLDATIDLVARRTRASVAAGSGAPTTRPLGDFLRDDQWLQSGHPRSRPERALVFDVKAGVARTVFYGPYLTLPGGDFELRLRISSQPERKFALFVTCDIGARRLAEASFVGAIDTTLSLRLGEPGDTLKEVEFVLMMLEDADATVQIDAFQLSTVIGRPHVALP